MQQIHKYHQIQHRNGKKQEIKITRRHEDMHNQKASPLLHGIDPHLLPNPKTEEIREKAVKALCKQLANKLPFSTTTFNVTMQ